MKCFDCGVEFNFCCSSLRSPSLAHGVHYHRPDCDHFKKNVEEDFLKKLESGEVKDKFEENCSECKELEKKDIEAKTKGLTCKRP